MTSFSPPTPFPPATIAKRRRKIPFGTRRGENYCTVRRRLLIAVYVCRRAGRTERREKQRISSYFFSKKFPSFPSERRACVLIAAEEGNCVCVRPAIESPLRSFAATATDENCKCLTQQGGASMSGGGVRCLNPLFLPSSLDVISWKEK